MPVVTRAQLLTAIDRRDWTIRVFGVSYPVAITFDDYVRALLLDDIIDITPQHLAALEHSFRERPNTLTNIRRLLA